ncbi:MAG: hypothetical protein HW402_490 [Dehalococcoidales bacterium]|nr:hypothetical protein [Dehalococcoidales bacterium]
MIRKASLAALIVGLFLFLLNPAIVRAQSGPTVLTSSAEAEFPLKLTFSLSAKSDVVINDIRLHYTVEQESYARVTSETHIQFMPATKVNVQWSWDMRKIGGLPPGSVVDYWWTVSDISGSKTESVLVSLRFDDERYPWRSVAESGVTVYWYQGDAVFAREIMLAAQQALARLAVDTGAYLKNPVEIYVYAHSRDLQGALIFPQEWAGGVAFYRYNAIAIGIAPAELAWGKRAVAHELTHQVVHQMTFNPYGGLPSWLDEGLAMYVEGSLDSGFAAFLEKAIADDTLISVRSLSSPFSAYAGQSYLSYAESRSLVEFLITTYGRSKMLELLDAFHQGSSYDGALVKVYGFDRDGLNTLWRDDVIKGEPRPAAGVSPLLPVLAALVTVVLLVMGLAAERWDWMRRW